MDEQQEEGVPGAGAWLEGIQHQGPFRPARERRGARPAKYVQMGLEHSGPDLEPQRLPARPPCSLTSSPLLDSQSETWGAGGGELLFSHKECGQGLPPPH
jgi:hypothetical protein